MVPVGEVEARGSRPHYRTRPGSPRRAPRPPPPRPRQGTRRASFVLCMALRLPGLTVERGSYLRTVRSRNESRASFHALSEVSAPAGAPFAARHPAGLLPFVFVCQIAPEGPSCCPMATGRGTPAPRLPPGGQFGQEGHRVVGHAQQESPPRRHQQVRPPPLWTGDGGRGPRGAGTALGLRARERPERLAGPEAEPPRAGNRGPAFWRLRTRRAAMPITAMTATMEMTSRTSSSMTPSPVMLSRPPVMLSRPPVMVSRPSAVR